MKWKRKHIVNIEEAHRRNLAGESIGTLATEYGMPKTTLNRYFHQAGYQILFNRRDTLRKSWYTKEKDRKIYTCPNAWKRALIRRHGYECMICGYDKIVEAHHIVPKDDGGKMTIENGCILCPNHHAEAHAGLIDLKVALSKRGELLENPKQGNQQPTHTSSNKIARGVNGSETTSRAKAIMDARAPRLSRRIVKAEYLQKRFYKV